MVEEKHTAHLVNLVDMGPLATKIKNYRTNFLTLKLIYFIILAQNFPLITSLMPDVLVPRQTLVIPVSMFRM